MRFCLRYFPGWVGGGGVGDLGREKNQSVVFMLHLIIAENTGL